MFIGRGGLKEICRHFFNIDKLERTREEMIQEKENSKKTRKKKLKAVIKETPKQKRHNQNEEREVTDSCN